MLQKINLILFSHEYIYIEKNSSFSIHDNTSCNCNRNRNKKKITIYLHNAVESLYMKNMYIINMSFVCPSSYIPFFLQVIFQISCSIIPY